MAKSFYITKSNRIIDENNVVVLMVESDPLYQQYLEFLENNGEILPTDFNLDEDLKKEKIEATKLKYELHRRNGWDAYQEFRAMIVEEIDTGIITKNQAFEIEANLKVAYDRIAQNGDWQTAHFELSKVVVSQPFVQPYLDLALNYIENYITKNYENK